MSLDFSKSTMSRQLPWTGRPKLQHSRYGIVPESDLPTPGGREFEISRIKERAVLTAGVILQTFCSLLTLLCSVY